mmetsp:Transcript_11497/g.48130  ORF Transcript_11497/g.48130 Transcript_11497/m.48130 type:complete len:399 (-) Transcript_11497:94-1290(-)
MRVEPVVEPRVSPLLVLAALGAQPLVHVRVHRGKINPGRPVVSHEVHALELRPRAGIGVQIQRGRLAEESLGTNRQQVARVRALNVRRHVLDPGLQRVAAVGADVVLQRCVRRPATLHHEVVSASRLVHQVPPENRRVVPVTHAGVDVSPVNHGVDVRLVQHPGVRIHPELVPAVKRPVAGAVTRVARPRVVPVDAAEVPPVVAEGYQQADTARARGGDGVVQPPERLLIVHPGLPLQGVPFLGSVAEPPRANHGDTQLHRSVQNLVHLAPKARLAAADHQVVGVGADEVEVLARLVRSVRRVVGSGGDLDHEARPRALHEAELRGRAETASRDGVGVGLGRERCAFVRRVRGEDAGEQQERGEEEERSDERGKARHARGVRGASEATCVPRHRRGGV